MKMIPRCIAMVWGIAVLIASGCTAMPPASSLEALEMEIPDAWAASSEARAVVDLQWLDRFQDRDLKQLTTEAIAHNHDLKVAAHRVRMAQASARMAGAPGRPFLNLNLPFSRRKTNFIGFPDFGFGGSEAGAMPDVISNIANTYGTSLDLSWELDLWGRIRAAESAALAEWQATAADYQAARSSLAAQVAKTWFALIEAQQQLELARQTVANFQETETIIADRFRLGQVEGGASSAELRLAKSDVASAREQQAMREEAHQQARRQLEFLLGRYPSGNIAERQDLPPLPSRPPAGLPSELLQRRPDILAAERRFALQGQRMKEASLARFPQLRLTGSGGTSTDDLGRILDSDFGVWNLAADLIQPILTGGQIRWEQINREEQHREALVHLQKTVLQAFLEVESALDSEQYLRQREDALAEAVSLAEEADRSARMDYRDGVSDILTVLTTQSRLLQLKSQWLTLRRVRLDTRINLHLALGGDFKASASQNP